LNKPKIKQDKSTIDIEFEKQKEECTFRPNAYTPTLLSSKSKSTMGQKMLLIDPSVPPVG